MFDFLNKILNIFLRKKKFKYIKLSDKSSIEVPNKNTIVIVKKNGLNVWAKFYCPCNCGNLVMLSLNPSISPYWKIKTDSKTKQVVTFNPSIHLNSFNCKSHFYIRDNKIIWV